jgi:hypothetical protein
VDNVRCVINIQLDLNKERDLYDALNLMSKEDCRTIEQEVYWIVREYVRDHVRFLEKEVKKDITCQQKY